MAEGHVKKGQNLLLNLLNGDGVARLGLALELVTLGARHMLYEPDVPINYVYFPVDGVMSMLAEVDDNIEVEVGTVGNEGMIGLPVFLGAEATPGRAFAQVPGQAYRLSVDEFKRLLKESPRATEILHRYTQALMIQVSQSAACNRIHSNHQRCARWLLHTQDHVGEDEFQLTQEFLAQMLGVRRATVSEIAGSFQASGVIEYNRGIICVLDRARLEAASCLCYDVIRKEYDRMYEQLQQTEK